MGVYVYTMRATKGTVNIKGIKEQANLLSYAFKPRWGYEQPAVFNQILTRAENFWAKRETPNVFVLGDKFENGCEVRTGWPKGSASCYDDQLPGEHVGFLKKIGRSWTVVDTEEQCNGI